MHHRHQYIVQVAPLKVLDLNKSGPGGPQHINQKLLRLQFKSLAARLVQRTVEPCKKARVVLESNP